MAFRDDREAHDLADEKDRYARIRHEEEAQMAKLIDAERAKDEPVPPRRRAWWETPALFAGGLVIVVALLAKQC